MRKVKTGDRLANVSQSSLITPRSEQDQKIRIKLRTINDIAIVSKI